MLAPRIGSRSAGMVAHGHARLRIDSDDDMYDDIPPRSRRVRPGRRSGARPRCDPRSEWKERAPAVRADVRSRAVATTKTHEENVAAQWVLHERRAGDALGGLRASARARWCRGRGAAARHPPGELPGEHEEYDQLDRAAPRTACPRARLARMLAIRGAKRALDAVTGLLVRQRLEHVEPRGSSGRPDRRQHAEERREHEQQDQREDRERRA